MKKLSLTRLLLTEQNIRELIQMYVSSLKRNNRVREDRYKSMIYVRLADLGFDRPHITTMINSLTDVDTEKDVDKIMSRYRLWGDDYADTFRATESTITEADDDREEDEDGVEQNIHNFKVIVQIPFTNLKNKDQKLRKLKFDLTILDIKIKKERPIDVAKLNPEAADSAAIDFAVMLELETEMTRTELEHELQPDYKILKLKEI
jgi:hypothetical protein|tara:strand:+ start:122 stop:736 length:615 start_codon:yes stop_codon:yes gene_type:complete